MEYYSPIRRNDIVKLRKDIKPLQVDTVKWRKTSGKYTFPVVSTL